MSSTSSHTNIYHVLAHLNIVTSFIYVLVRKVIFNSILTVASIYILVVVTVEELYFPASVNTSEGDCR